MYLTTLRLGPIESERVIYFVPSIYKRCLGLHRTCHRDHDVIRCDANRLQKLSPKHRVPATPLVVVAAKGGKGGDKGGKSDKGGKGGDKGGKGGSSGSVTSGQAAALLKDAVRSH